MLQSANNPSDAGLGVVFADTGNHRQHMGGITNRRQAEYANILDHEVLVDSILGWIIVTLVIKSIGRDFQYNNMPQVTTINKNQWVLLQQSLQQDFNNQWFDKDYWLAQGRLLGANSGRGSAWTIKSEHGKWVLRHYYRGGLFGKLIKDSYFWIGLNKTRSFQEYKILQQLNALKLPAPQPVAAHVVKRGLFYSTDLIMSHIPHDMTFAQLIHECIDDIRCWRLVGQTIAQFHQHRVYHSDLNTHNILLNQDHAFLIDFDKAQIMKKNGAWQKSNLTRLKRSIHKVSDLSCDLELKKHWQALMEGYQSV